MVLTVVMELPFFYYSKNILGTLGISGSVVIAHIAFIIRAFSYPLHVIVCFLHQIFSLICSMYSYLTSAWWVLPIEITHGIAFSCIWTAAVAHFGALAPPGREATFQVDN